MMTQAQYEQRDDSPVDDHIVRLHGLRWGDYLRLLTRFLDRPTTYEAMRGYRQAPRSGTDTPQDLG